MEREQGCDQGAAPEGAGHLAENQEEQEGGGKVESEVGEMMSGRLQSVELGIQHVREPGDRMPVGRVAGAESPVQAIEREAGLHPGIPGYVGGVVQGDEIAPGDGPPGERSEQAQQQTEQKLLLPGLELHCRGCPVRACSSCRAWG